MTTNERTELGLQDTGAGCACCTTSSTVALTESDSVVSEDIFVSGMTCSHCVMSVTEELTAIDGVQNVSVDLNIGGVSRVTVNSTAPVDPAAVQAAVEEAGYSLASSPA